MRVSGCRRVPEPPARMTPFMGGDATRLTVLVDAENVRRSRWPNLSRRELVERCRDWASTRGFELVVVFDGSPATRSSADDWLAEHAREHAPYWLVTSDRELRDRAGGTP